MSPPRDADAYGHAGTTRGVLEPIEERASRLSRLALGLGDPQPPCLAAVRRAGVPASRDQIRTPEL